MGSFTQSWMCMRLCSAFIALISTKSQRIVCWTIGQRVQSCISLRVSSLMQLVACTKLLEVLCAEALLMNLRGLAGFYFTARIGKLF
jgi:hypothetical protein